MPELDTRLFGSIANNIRGRDQDASDRERQSALDAKREQDRAQAAFVAASQRIAADPEADVDSIINLFPSLNPNHVRALQDQGKRAGKAFKAKQVSGLATEAAGAQTGLQKQVVSSKLEGLLGGGQQGSGTPSGLVSGQNNPQAAAGTGTANRDIVNQLGAEIQTQQQGAAAAAEQQEFDRKTPLDKQLDAAGVFGLGDRRAVGIADLNRHLSQGDGQFKKIGNDLVARHVISQETLDDLSKQMIATTASGSGFSFTSDGEGGFSLIEGPQGGGNFTKAKAIATLQDRLVNVGISEKFATEMLDAILRDPSKPKVGFVGGVKRKVQSTFGVLGDIDRTFGSNLTKWAQGGASRISKDFYSGAITDPGLESMLGEFLAGYDPENATVDQFSFIISYNLVAARQRGRRIATQSTVEAQEKRLGLKGKASVRDIASALRVSLTEMGIIKRTLNERLRKDFGVSDPIDVDFSKPPPSFGDVPPSAVPTIGGPSPGGQAPPPGLEGFTEIP